MATQLQELSETLTGLVATTAPSVVAVHSKGGRSSGFVWRPGLIVTADDALAEEGEVQVIAQGGAGIGAKIVGRDPTTDVALLRVERTDLPALTFGTGAPGAGALAVVVGMERGVATVAWGVVSLSGPAWRSLRGGEIDARIELGARMRQRSEGAVAVDASGQAFGMAVFAPRRRTLVIPAATLSRVAARLETHGRIPRGYLGLRLHAVAVESGGTGAMVVNVDPKGPGAAAGIHQGDVLVGWDGKPVTGMRPLLSALGPDSVGQKVALELRRAGKTQQAMLTIAERPAD